jgi:hypothetical protein
MFLNERSLEDKVEEIVLTKRLSHIDALISFCSTNELEFEDIAKLITPNLKDKIKMNAEEDGLMKRSARLPI